MQRVFMFVFVLLVACVGSAQAAGLPALLVGDAAKDVEVFLKPAGVVIDVLPATGKGSEQRRTVRTLRQQGGWVCIAFDGDKEGWVRTEVLRGCSALQGTTNLMSSSRKHAQIIAEIKPWTPLYFVAMRKGWMQVDYRNEEQMLVRGWLPEQSLSTDPAQCWKP